MTDKEAIIRLIRLLAKPYRTLCFPILLGEGPDEEQWDGIELDRGGYHLFKEVYDDFEAHLYCELLTPNEEEYIRGILENILINN